jgi:hypothetical protein
LAHDRHGLLRLYNRGRSRFQGLSQRQVLTVMGKPGLLVVSFAVFGGLTPTPVNPVSSSPSASALLDTAPRKAVAAVSHLTTRFVRTETASGQAKCRVDLLLHHQFTARCTGRRDTGDAGVGTRHVPGLRCPARREGLGSITRRMASRHPGGGAMSSIVYVVGAVVIIGVVLKMMGVY